MAEVRPIDANALEEEISSLVMVITGLRCGKGVLSDYITEYRKSILRIVNVETAHLYTDILGILSAPEPL